VDLTNPTQKRMDVMEPVNTIEATATETPTVEAQVEQGKSTQQPQTEDLLTRVSKFTIDNDPSVKSTEEINSGVFNDSELTSKLESIEDPVLKEQMSALRKSLVSGVNGKFQEIAEIRKELQAMKTETKAVQNEQWTPERVQSLINDPTFVEAAQKVAGTESIDSDEYSSLSDAEKARIQDMESKIKELKDLNAKSLETQQIQLRQQQHEQFKQKYSDYDPKQIDTITYDMLNGKIQATPEHIYKAWNYDKNINASYEMGRRDEREGVRSKVQSMSAEGIQTSHASTPYKKEDNESQKNFINRIIADKLSKLPRK